MEHNEEPKKGRGTGIGEFFYGLLFFFILRVDTLLFSVPVWILLILHFAVGLPIKWFWLGVGVFFLIGILRYLLIVFARWGGSGGEPQKENKNPYSNKKREE